MDPRKNDYRGHNVRNQALYYYRSTHINNMKEGKHTDFSDEPDLDMLSMHDLKLHKSMSVDLIDNKYVPWINPNGSFNIKIDLDEIVHLGLAKPIEQKN